MERIGEIGVNTFGSKMTIIEYKNNRKITVQFESGYKTNAYYYDFKKGRIADVYEKRTCKIGYLGEGEYSCFQNLKSTPYYEKWRSMIKRCYSLLELKKNPTYQGCTVCEEWHNFQNFAKWYNENYYEIPGEQMHLDKDILVKGNKVYSPETCIFVAESINNLFVKNNVRRGELPIGCYYKKAVKKYAAQCNKGKRRIIFLGTFNTPEEAFQAYKEFKESYIKEVADEYKDKIPLRLYEAMYKYEVEITD